MSDTYSKALSSQIEPIITELNIALAKALTKKCYGPYMKHGKQHWRNYHREIKRKDAKTYWEVQYLNLSPEFKPIYSEATNEKKVTS